MFIVVLGPWITLGLAAGLFVVWWRTASIPGRVSPAPWRGTIAAALVVAAAAYPAQRLKDYNFFFGDEGVVIAVAQAMAEGALLYRDVWEFLQPGSFALLAGVFSLAGSGVHVIDACMLLLIGGVAGALHRLVAQHVSPRAAWFCVLAFLLQLHPLSVWLSPHWMSTGSALLAIACLVHDPPPARRFLLLAAGACIGVTFLFQQHKGVFLAATLGGAYLAACMATGAGARVTARVAGWVLAGAALPAIPLVLWLTVHGLWGEWWYATFTWVLQGYGPANTTRPPLFPVVRGVPLLMLMQGLWNQADVTLARLLPLSYGVAPLMLLWKGPGGTRWRLWVVWAGALGVFGTAFARYEHLRLLYTGPATLALCAFLSAHLRAILPPVRRGVTHLGRVMLMGVCVCAVCLATVQQYGRSLRLLRSGARLTMPSPRGAVTLWTPGGVNLGDVQTVITALQGLPRETRIFVYPTGWGFGYLSGLRNGTPYHVAIPGYTQHAQWDRLHGAVGAGAVDIVVWDRSYSPAWMASTLPALAPESVWDNPFVSMLQGPEWEPWVETATVAAYRRTAAP